MTAVVCALIRDGEGRILAAQRPPGADLAGKWEFPGGKIEANESPEAALLREISEELGCRIELGNALPAVRHAHAGGAIELHPFLARVVSGTPLAHEHTAIQWVALDEWETLDWAAADRLVLEELAR